MREASSLLIAEKPPWFVEEGPSQPNLGNDGKDGGDATMVVIGISKLKCSGAEGCREGVYRN